MKITDVKSVGIDGNFEWLVVRVETDAGISGLGECGREGSILYGAERIRWMKHVVGAVKQTLLGEDPTEVERLHERMTRNAENAPLMQVASGVEMALWDITGKAYGQPIWKLLGGRYRDKVKVYADYHAGRLISKAPDDYRVEGDFYTPEAYAAMAGKMKSLGFKHLKFDVNPYVATAAGPDAVVGGNLTPAGMRFLLRIVDAVREEVGDSVDLSLGDTGSMGYLGVAFGNAVERYNLAWGLQLDELAARNIEATLKLTEAVRTPTCGTVLLHTWRSFKEIIDRHALTVIAPDLPEAGGLTDGKMIGQLAAYADLPMCPHNICSPVGTLAQVHACATMRSFLSLEVHHLGVPWWEDLVTRCGKPIIQDGFIEVPNRPGIGVELDGETVKAHMVEGETFWE